MNALCCIACFALFIGVIAWLWLPMYTVEIHSFIKGDEIALAGGDAFVAGFEEFDSWGERLHNLPFVTSTFSILFLLMGLLVFLHKPAKQPNKNDYGMLAVETGFGGLFLFLLMQVSGGAMSSVIHAEAGSGYIVMLLAFATTFILAIPLYRNAPPAPTRKKKTTKQTDPPSLSEKNGITSSDGKQLYQCCQCGKIAERTEFYTIGAYGMDHLGTCHQCYDKFY